MKFHRCADGQTTQCLCESHEHACGGPHYRQALQVSLPGGTSFVLAADRISVTRKAEV
jgi:hypothetical protein